MAKRYEPTPDTNIKRKPDGTYLFIRNKHERSLYTKDWKIACERKEEILAQLKGFGAGSNIRFSTVWPEYVKYSEKLMNGKVPKKKPIRLGTFREIKYIGDKYLMPYFKKKKLSQFESHWDDYCEWTKVSDLNNHRKVTNQFFKWAKKNKKVKKLPDLTDIPFHKKRQRRIIKPDELKKIFENSSGKLTVFLTLALYNGLRRTEIMTLRVEDIHLAERYIVIREEFNKKDRGRSIPINETVSVVIESYLSSRDIKSPWLFPKRRRPSQHAIVTALMGPWKKCLEGAGLSDITWHDFRATFEKHMNKSTLHTDVQKEKFADATIDVQKKIYVNMDHEDLRGLENSVQVPGLDELILNKSNTVDESPRIGKTPGVRK